MLTFVDPSLLLWGLPLVGVPVLIHLINLLRHRRVQWAAMEFLLASQKKNSSWIKLKELLLLLLRMRSDLQGRTPKTNRLWRILIAKIAVHHWL